MRLHIVRTKLHGRWNGFSCILVRVRCKDRPNGGQLGEFTVVVVLLLLVLVCCIFFTTFLHVPPKINLFNNLNKLKKKKRHRAHHRYTDTEKDPYNALRGFFYSHIGWLFLKQDHKRIGRVDISDLTSSRAFRSQHQFYVPIALAAAFLTPAVKKTQMHSFSRTHSDTYTHTRINFFRFDDG